MCLISIHHVETTAMCAEFIIANVDEVTGACMSCFALIVKISAARNARPLRNGVVFLSVCSFVRLSPVKFVKLFTRWQHLVASGGLSYRLRYACSYYEWAQTRVGLVHTSSVLYSWQLGCTETRAFYTVPWGMTSRLRHMSIGSTQPHPTFLRRRVPRTTSNFIHSGKSDVVLLRLAKTVADP